MIRRKEIIIYIQNKKAVKELEKLSMNITYINEKANYVVAYIDRDNSDKFKKQILSTPGVKRVEESLVDLEEFSFKE